MIFQLQTIEKYFIGMFSDSKNHQNFEEALSQDISSSIKNYK